MMHRCPDYCKGTIPERGLRPTARPLTCAGPGAKHSASEQRCDDSGRVRFEAGRQGGASSWRGESHRLMLWRQETMRIAIERMNLHRGRMRQRGCCSRNCLSTLRMRKSASSWSLRRRQGQLTANHCRTGSGLHRVEHGTAAVGYSSGRPHPGPPQDREVQT
jgi:hypothetical protein